MSNTLLMGQYLETHSIFHRLDPRTKLVSMIIIMLSFLMLDTFVSYVVATLFLVGILWLSKIPLLVFWRGLKLGLVYFDVYFSL